MRRVFSIICSVILLTFISKNSIAVTDSTTLSSSIVTSNVTLNKFTTYLMKGFNYVRNGATITIPAGTLILGDFESKGTLVIERGSKIFANGTANSPVVFTSERPAGSRAAGDWGGIIILGRSAINTSSGADSAEIEGFGPGLGPIYGGQPVVNNDNSGVLSYVRIEFPGVNLTGISGNEINGLTMGGVGSGTTIHHVQVSYSGDDSFEWFGGNVDCKYLLAYKGLDDDWDCDNGFRGRIQYGLSVRDKDIADISSSNGFEIDNNNNSPSNTNNPRTRPFFSNMTVVGPFETTSTPVNPLFQRGGHLRRNMQACIYNSLIMGWRTGILFDGSGVCNDANGGTVQLRTNIFSGNLTLASQTGGTVNPDPVTFITSTNTIYSANTSVQLANPFNIYPDPSGNNIKNWMPVSGSPALSGSDFSNPNLSGFEVVSYRGAFGTNNWSINWSQFNPKNYALPNPQDFIHLDLKLALEGPYDANTNSMACEDTVIVSLVSTACIEMETVQATINPNTLTGTFSFDQTPTGTYYIVVKHRNSIETWSKSGGESLTRGSDANYDFTPAASQAFGNNMKLIDNSPVVYGMYTGDPNQDCTVDAGDLSDIDNDAFNFATGYIPEDLNCDYVVDASDLSLADNNAFNFVGCVSPCP